jgi:hypothetical protein
VRTRRAALLGLCLAPAAGYALTWDYVPTVILGARYETNPSYVADNDLEDDAYSGVLDLSASLRGEADRARLTFRPRVRFTEYTGAENSDALDQFDWFLPLDGTWGGQRAQYAFAAGYSDISSRESEIRLSDPNEPGQPGSSGRVVIVDEDQERWYVAPSATYLITPRDQLGLTLSLDDVTYDKAELTNRSNYEAGSAGVSWTRSLGIKTRASASVTVDAFRAEQPGSPVENETISYSAEIGYEYAWSDVTTVGLTVGASYSDVSVTGLEVIDDDQNPTTPPVPCFDPQQQALVPCELETDDQNFVGQLFLRQKPAETITTELSVSRSIQPNSDGAQVTQDVARVFVSRDFTPRFGGRIGGTYVRQEAVGSENGTLGDRFDREYMQAEVGVTWRLSRSWAIGAAYNFSSDEQKGGIASSTTNNTVNVQLRYQGLGSH